MSEANQNQSLTRDTRGVAFTEYLVLMTVVTILGSVAVVGIGVPMLRTFRYAQLMLSIPLP